MKDGSHKKTIVLTIYIVIVFFICVLFYAGCMKPIAGDIIGIFESIFYK